MPLSKSDAADALRTVEDTERFSRSMRGYAAAAPHFFIWGMVWAAGYGLSAALPDKRTLVWFGAIAVGALSSAIADARTVGGGKASVWRSVAIAGSVAAIVGVTMTVLSPLPPRQEIALVPLMAAGFYLLMGIWGGPRFGVAGLLLGAVTVVGYFFAGDAFGYWMAAAGGGLLFVTGLWLRSV